MTVNRPKLRLVSRPEPTTSLSELQLSIKEYLIALQQGGATEKTLYNYGWQLDRLARWLAERDVYRPADVSRLLLREWGAGLFEAQPVDGLRRKKPVWDRAIIKQAVTACRSFFTWLTDEEGLLDDNPALALKVPKVKKREQRTLTADEVQRLIEACPADTPKGLRDRALINLLVDTGLRAGEVCRLSIADLHLGERYLVVAIKGENEERGWFGLETVAGLERWLGVRWVRRPQDDHVFVATGGLTPGEPLTVPGLEKILKAIGRKAGVPGCSPHTFRRTFACLLIEMGAPSRLIQELGRWSDIRMVEGYTLALQVGKLAAGYSPVDHLKRAGLLGAGAERESPAE